MFLFIYLFFIRRLKADEGKEINLQFEESWRLTFWGLKGNYPSLGFQRKRFQQIHLAFNQKLSTHLQSVGMSRLETTPLRFLPPVSSVSSLTFTEKKHNENESEDLLQTSVTTV